MRYLKPSFHSTIATPLLLASFLIVASPNLQSQQIVADIERATRFVCAVPPQPPANWPGGVSNMIQQFQTNCGRQEISGFYFKVTFREESGNPPPGTVLVQRLQRTTTARVTTPQSTDCGDHVIGPISSWDVEYFPAYPVEDYHAIMGCCEQEGDILATMQLAFLPQPAGSQPVQPDEVAGAAFSSAAQKNTAGNAAWQNRTINWGYQFEFDACDFNKARGTASYIEFWTQPQLPAGNPNNFSLAPVQYREEK